MHLLVKQVIVNKAQNVIEKGCRALVQVFKLSAFFIQPQLQQVFCASHKSTANDHHNLGGYPGKDWT